MLLGLPAWTVWPAGGGRIRHRLSFPMLSVLTLALSRPPSVQQFVGAAVERCPVQQRRAGRRRRAVQSCRWRRRHDAYLPVLALALALALAGVAGAAGVRVSRHGGGR